jgi:hypothetical protein
MERVFLVRLGSNSTNITQARFEDWWKKSIPDRSSDSGLRKNYCDSWSGASTKHSVANTVQIFVTALLAANLIESRYAKHMMRCTRDRFPDRRIAFARLGFLRFEAASVANGFGDELSLLGLDVAGAGTEDERNGGGRAHHTITASME